MLVALYFHENQLTYPLPPRRARDLAFPWINYTGALAADAMCFNSDFHRRTFLEALPGTAGPFHDHQELDLIDGIAAKSRYYRRGSTSRASMPWGLGNRESGTLGRSLVLGTPRSDPQSPVILWNSRWEYDKGPQAFLTRCASWRRAG